MYLLTAHRGVEAIPGSRMAGRDPLISGRSPLFVIRLLVSTLIKRILDLLLLLLQCWQQIMEDLPGE